MQYVLLIYDEEGERESPSGFRLSGDLRAKGTLIASEELQPVATATTVRVRNGDTPATARRYGRSSAPRQSGSRCCSRR